jgi:hypothetical protein
LQTEADSIVDQIEEIGAQKNLGITVVKKPVRLKK